FEEETILKSFETTGISLFDPEVILRRFKKTTQDDNQGSRESSKKDAQKLRRSLHHISAKVQLLHHENAGLREALAIKTKHKKNVKPLDLQQRQEYHGGAVFWSSSKVRKARVRQSVKE
ncbi:uncharacterized protein CC84DRAFT_1054094, partial [Paraphaeosphaeria sporulosa]